MSAVVELARFHHAEPLRACTKVLDEAGILYRLSNDSLTSNVSMMRVAYNATCIVTVREEDLGAAQQALLSEARSELASGVPADHYFMSSSNEDLHDVLNEPLEWSPYDLAVAEKLLQDRGVALPPVLATPVVSPFVPDVPSDKPLPGKRRASLMHILIGFVFGGALIGMAIGFSFICCTESSPIPGRKQFVYDEETRRMGVYMIAFSFVVTALWAALLLWFRMYRSYQ